MSISEISSNDALNLDTLGVYLLKMPSTALQGCIRVADKVKNVVLGSALAVAGTAFLGAEVLIKSLLPPASGAVALYISKDAITYLYSINTVNSSKHDLHKNDQMLITVFFATFGAIALTTTA